MNKADNMNMNMNIQETTHQPEGGEAIRPRDLLACPFCGNKWCSIRNAGAKGVLRQVYCRDVDCGARGPARPSEDHAIAAWNNRPGIPLTFCFCPRCGDQMNPEYDASAGYMDPFA